MDNRLLAIMVLAPAVSALPLAFVRDDAIVKRLAMAIALAVLGLGVAVVLQPVAPVVRFDWIQSLRVQFFLRADGLSASLMLLTALLTVLSMMCSWTTIEHRVKEFFCLMLVLETGMLGVFCAFDLFLFYVFWELTLIPMVFIIGVWGGPRRVYSAVKFLIYTLAGSLFMLAGIVVVAIQAGSFNYDDVLRVASIRNDSWLFLAFAIAFAIKVPMFPFHTWLPDAHVEAPTAGSVILAGVLLKMGGYGLARFAIPLFPVAAEHFSWLMMLVGVIGVIFGAFMAMTQGDVKRLIAYSSVSHMGFVVFGLFSWRAPAFQGALLEMLNHGLSTGMLFLLVGIIYERTHRRGVDDFGGLAESMPGYATVFLVATLSSIGLPGLNGFIGEIMILFGGLQTQPIMAGFAATGVILGAVYMLRLYKNIFFGEARAHGHDGVADLTRWERAYLAPIVALMILLGVVPSVVPFIKK